MTYFTVEQANHLLPHVSPIVATLVAQYRHLMVLRHQVAPVLAKAAWSSGSREASRLAMVFIAIERCVRQLQALGIQLKDPATGLCDFPARHEGRDILLCWRLGEARVEWWHELDTGFGGRRPIHELDHDR